jgi:hypothetical protein
MADSDLVIKLGDLFVWVGWKKARNSVIELVADFFAAVSLWILYALFVVIAHWLTVEEDIRVLVELIHSLAAVLSFSFLAGFGFLRLVIEIAKPSSH